MNLLNEIGSHMSGFEQLRVMMETNRKSGFPELLDIRIVEVDDGRVIVEATPDTHVYNPNGTVHGGFSATVLDTACGYAVLTKMAADQTFTTLELKIAYHKAMTRQTGIIRAEAKVLTIGRRAAFTEAKLTDSAGKLYASATSSLLIMSK